MFSLFSFVPLTCTLLQFALSVVMNWENNGVEWKILRGILLVLRNNHRSHGRKKVLFQ